MPYGVYFKMKEIRKKISGLLKTDWGNAENNESYNNYDERKRLMKFNRFFSNYKVFTCSYFGIALLILFLLVIFILGLQADFNGLMGHEDRSFLERLYSLRFLIIVGIIAIVAGYFRFAYLIRVSFGNINIGQKGTARWATREEINQQYKKVPEKNLSFLGMGGIPIARNGDKIYIDDTNTNTLIIGGTRSGKDEIYGRPFVDIISRAEEKCSMIITDPKLESAFAAIPELKRRGYNTYILNYIDPIHSDGNNPLDMIKEEYKAGNIEGAQDLCSSLAYYVFAPNPEEKDPFWTDKARDVFTAFCYAEIEDNITADIEENMRRKAAHERVENERKKEYYMNLYGGSYEDFRRASYIRKILKAEPDLSNGEIIEEFHELCQAKGMKMDLSASDIPRLKNFKFKRSSFVSQKYYPVYSNERKITLNSIVKLCSTLSQTQYNESMTYLDKYFKDRDEENFAKVMYGDIISLPKSTKSTIMSSFSKGVKVFTYESIAKMTAESTFKITEIAFGKKPVAIFLGIPDYDKSKHFLATVFINQVTFLLSKLSLSMPGGKLPRRVHFWINEFGNLPVIENLENYLTVGLGRNIIWTLLLQSYGQLERYADIKETIKDNCGNKIYIMASGGETTEEVSEALGSETQTVVNRTGKKLSIQKELTEMSEDVPLMRPEQLTKLELGETIVIRTMKRTDLAGNTIKPHPIKNFGKYRMIMAHEYLKESFPYDQMLYKPSGTDQIIKENPDYANMKINVVEGYINSRSHIDTGKYTRSGKEIIRVDAFRKKKFKAGNDLEPKDLLRMNRIFNLMELPDEQRQEIAAAGTHNEEGEIAAPELLPTNLDIERFARKLIRSNNKKDSMRGYEILDILLPLGQKEKSEEEKLLDKQIEEEIMGLDEMDFDDAG